MISLRLELAEHDDRQDHVVLGEAHERERIGEHHRRVEHVRARGHFGTSKPPRARRWWMVHARIAMRATER